MDLHHCYCAKCTKMSSMSKNYQIQLDILLVDCYNNKVIAAVAVYSAAKALVGRAQQRKLPEE